MKKSKFTFMCITFIVFCLILSQTFASGTVNSNAKENKKSSQKSRKLKVKPSAIGDARHYAMNGMLENKTFSSPFAPGEFKETIPGNSISSPFYTPLQRQIKTAILLQGLYYQRSNYIQFYADYYDIAVTNDYVVNWDTAMTNPVLSLSLKNANGNIKVLDYRSTYSLPQWFASDYSEANKYEDNQYVNESWFIHTADQDGNELAFTPDNRLRESNWSVENPVYSMNPVNTGYQDHMATSSNYILSQHTQLDGIFWDGAGSYLREDILYYTIPCEAHTTERGSNGDIIIKINSTPAKVAYQFVNYVMVKVFDNAACQGTDLFAANEGSFILGDNKEIHLNPSDPDCPAEGAQVWVKYAASGKIPNYVKNNWVTGLTQLFTKVKNSIGTKLSIANSGGGLFERNFYEGLDGLMAEAFMKANWSTYLCGQDLNEWQAKMADLVDSENRGKHLMAVSGITYSVNLNCDIFVRFRLFCYASFLLGIDKTAQHESNASFMFIYHNSPDDSMYNPQYYPEWDLPIGYALGPYSVDSATGLYVRTFSNGLVLVNPYPPLNCANACDPQDPNRKVYQLNGTYYDYKGQAMTSVTLVPNSGAVLVQNPGNYVAPNLLEDCKGLQKPVYSGCN